LFPSVQSMKVHDLAKCEWSLFTKRKWMKLLTEIVVYND
jgi:hypothetical protein